MNEDEYWLDLMNKVMYGSTYKDLYGRYETFDGLSSSQVYDLLTSVRTGKEVSYYNNYSRGDEVATLVLEAYSNGVDFETLIKKNTMVRQYWNQIQSDKAAKLKQIERDNARREKLAEARAAKKAAKDEAMSKLTQEELEAFGLINKKRVAKR